MTDLICPFCGEELVHENMSDYWCAKCNLGDNPSLYGSKGLWQALIQAKQDLEKARYAITDVFSYVKEHEKDIGGCAVNIGITLGNALEQIEHKE